MVVTNGSEKEICASVEFLKWFTDDAQNISFSVQSGYLPVKKSANNKEAILSSGAQISRKIEETISVAVDTVNSRRLYTTKAFADGNEARNILEYALSDKAQEDRKTVQERLRAGMTLEEAAEEFCSEEHFEQWYQAALEKLKAFEDR